ncbi:hypothetical protein U9M48_038041 [Paspalum notatum var. saurae]|uniref:F-box domain-containing protein n=1 Tax=Paspalum notatum var. saurae TaxID=547442 RepID=A0AAQ3UMH8_PASNO
MAERGGGVGRASAQAIRRWREAGERRHEEARSPALSLRLRLPASPAGPPLQRRRPSDVTRPIATGRGLQAMDPLAYLPAHLLDEILGRLDLRDAVRTSALSRAWRRRWESVPGLALSFPDGTPPSVIGGVLFLYTAPRISRFACQVDEESASHLDRWLIALSGRTVQSISIRISAPAYLEFFDPERFPLHSSIFSCAHLVSLHLEVCGIPLVPVGFAGFPVLEELYLSRVEFQDPDDMDIEATLQTIIRRSPLLRVLSFDGLRSCPLDNGIQLPNLHSLTICSGYYDMWRFAELPCLQIAKILMLDYYQHGQDLAEFLAGLSQVRELTFLVPAYIVQIGTLPTFYNLKSLELARCFTAIDRILLMFSLLRSSPNLEKLKMEMQGLEMVVDWEFLNAQWTDGMCANLQIVEIISDPIRRWLPISFMKLILSKASILRTLSVDVCLSSQDDPRNELLTCRRASAQAQVLFKVQLERFWKL